MAQAVVHHGNAGASMPGCLTEGHTPALVSFYKPAILPCRDSLLVEGAVGSQLLCPLERCAPVSEGGSRLWAQRPKRLTEGSTPSQVSFCMAAVNFL